MATTAPSRNDTRFRARPVPPLPHPSWTQGAERPAADRLRNAGEFWSRLGL